MLFNSVAFLVFFPIVTFLYFAFPPRYRWFILLAASSYFYMCFVPKYLLILAFTILVDYFAGILIEQAQGRRRKLYLIASLIANVGVLFFFKYFNFFNYNAAGILEFLGLNYAIRDLSILLPIGLSFHTFQSMSYTIEVYRGKQVAEKRIGIFALYVMFYPQLVAGPIERPQNLLHQFYETHRFEWARVVSGLQLMLWGLFKKVIIADRLAFFVNEVYGRPEHYPGPALFIATVFFAFQIYCDFSGYSDMALGAAEVMGFKLMKNFDRPYFSKSISEFWRRWHISLATWFRDYLYIPLGGNRVSRPRWLGNLMLTFLISGLWHGASWNFVVWGGLNGLYLAVGTFVEKWKIRTVDIIQNKMIKSLVGILEISVTFGLVCVAWVFFRATSIAGAFGILIGIFTGWGQWFSVFSGDLFVKNILIVATRVEYIFAWLGILFLVVVERLQGENDLRASVGGWPKVLRWVWYSFLFLAVIFFGVFKNSQFIYFQF